MQLFTERHADKIRGELSCLDRIIITGTLPGICYADGMTAYLKSQHIRIFDYTKWAEPLREQIRTNAQNLAQKAGLEIQYLRKSHIRKEALVREIVQKRGDHEGLVHIFSAMEACDSYKPWHDKNTGKTFLKTDSGKCLHYYFYFIDKELGLSYMRVPTWAPFRLQFYFNGHNALAAALRKRKIDFCMLDNAFAKIADWQTAQTLADDFSVERLHRVLDRYARLFCPAIKNFAGGYHWSLMQAEYATDIVFKRQQDLAPVYDALVRTAVHAVKAEHVFTFLGRKLTGHYNGECGNDLDTRIQGTRIKHYMNKVAIKMYDKHGLILRIETTVNDPTFFRHHRKVEHRDGGFEMKMAPLKKTIYSLPALVELTWAANRRYLEFISTIDDPTFALRDLEKISRPFRDGERSVRGFNLFDSHDLGLFQTLVAGQFNISGFKNRHLRELLHKKSHQVSLIIKRLRTHGLIKKIAHCYKYYLTSLGRRVVAVALRLRETVIIPELSSYTS